MYIKDVWLRNYRNYENLHLELGTGTTVFLGKNGAGKTNIVEAIFYSGNLHSHRIPNDGALIRRERGQSEIKIRPVRGKLQLTLHLIINAKSRNEASINRGAAVSPRKIRGIVRTVLFSPEDLNLVKGDRQGRRNFIDAVLILLYPTYFKLKSDGEKILKQRNALLKSLGTARQPPRERENLSDTLKVWNTYFIKNSAQISWYRTRLIKELSKLTEERYRKLSGGEKKAKLVYEPSVAEYTSDPETTAQEKICGFERWYAAAVKDTQSLELIRGASLLGPQRDDMKIILDEELAKRYASHGESWSLALSLKLASYDLLRESDPEADDPVVILDDVFAELDNGRKKRLAEMVKGVEQLLITAAVQEDIPDIIMKNKNVAIVDVYGGKAVGRKKTIEAL